jgi:hypothetical protein
MSDLQESFREGLDLLNYTDFFYKGYRPNTPFIVKEVDAIKNALKLFLFSKQGDYGRNITKGGPLVKYIGKPLDESTQAQIYQDLFDTLVLYDNITVNNIYVGMDKENRKWDIQISFSDTFNKFTDTVNFEMG